MTREELRNLTLYWLDDLQGSYFTATQVNDWLNNAQRECQKLLLQAGQNYYVVRKTTSLVLNQQDYVLPLDFLKLNRLEVIISGTAPNEVCSPVTAITVNQQPGGYNNNGVPSYYFIKKNRLVLWPAPNVTYTLRMYYSYRVADMTLDNSVPDVPEEFHQYLALLAAQDGLLKDQRDPTPLLEKIKYYESMFKSEAQERAIDGPRGIVETGMFNFSEDIFY